MDRETDTGNAGTQQEASADTTTSGFPARVIAKLRMRIRRLFKKEDPNIYPFF